MIIEIRKAGFVNKGAEMMLLSIINQVMERYPNATLAMAPTTERGSQPFSKISKLGFRSKFRLRRGRVDFSWMGKLIPQKIRNAYGIVLDSEINVVLDASGFSYSDQWGTYDCEELLYAVKKGKLNGQKFILLPQAFGPFDNKRNRKNISKAILCCDLVFARDSVSYDFLKTILNDSSKNVIQKPDFTCGLQPVITECVASKKGMVPIVPNYRMLDKTGMGVSDKYINALTMSMKTIISSGLKPYFLIHETDLDKNIALKVIAVLDVNCDIEIVEEQNPEIIKGYLSYARFVVSSRYHATISALSQCVPVVGTSWSHKYEELFSEYDYHEGLCELGNQSQLDNLILSLCDDKQHSVIESKLRVNSLKVKNHTLEMWKEVFNVIEK